MMKLTNLGERIAEARKKYGYTQEELAEAVGVTAQAVSKWENGWNLPDIEKLLTIAEVLDTPYSVFLEDEKPHPEFRFRDRLFNEGNMFTRMKVQSLQGNLTETYQALEYMREKHVGQYRKPNKYSHEKVQYINHPLMMSCHAYALGVRDDVLLASILLHDVLEDTETSKEDLPFSDEVRDTVECLTFRVLPGMTKEESKAVYYDRISQNKRASIVKIFDRCNNVSDMAACFAKEKQAEYIEETERYVIPLLRTIKNRYPEYSQLSFVVKYHIISVLETIKYALV